jgi:hypothetical protein
VSAYLTAQTGPTVAEAAGLAKELKDAEENNNGFSFIDLAADKAGIRFALQILETEVALEEVAQDFQLRKVMPDIQGLEEGIPSERFRREFGSTDDERFQKIVRLIESRLENLPTAKR